MAEFCVAAETSAGDLYLGIRVPENHLLSRPHMLPAVRILRMIRYPDQHAIIWPDKPVENDPLPGGAVARLRILREAAEPDRQLLFSDRDYGASVRRCALIALGEGRPEHENRLIRLELAGRRGRIRSTMILTDFGREAMAMHGIPDQALRVAERRLRARYTAMDAAMAALADARDAATSLTGTLANTDGGGRSNRPADRVARAAQRLLEAEERVQALQAWEAVFDRVDRDFPPGSPEGTVRDLCMYDIQRSGEKRGGPCMTMADVARMHHVDRQTVTRRRDMILERVAWYASEAGLLRGEERP